MVTAKTQYSLRDAEKYFENHLAVADYYEQGTVISGERFAEGAVKLSLEGRVERKEFLALCQNRDPSSDETLTQRQRASGSSGNEAERREIYDFIFFPPKSVSIAGLVGQDQNVIQAHHRALRVALKEFDAKSARPGGEIELSDGRVLDKGFHEFVPGYAVTSYGSQGRTVDYVLFSDSTVKAATNAQQWYVTISRAEVARSNQKA